MMQLGSVILKVESRCVADSMWCVPPLLLPSRVLYLLPLFAVIIPPD